MYAQELTNTFAGQKKSNLIISTEDAELKKSLRNRALIVFPISYIVLPLAATQKSSLYTAHFTAHQIRLMMPMNIGGPLGSVAWGALTGDTCSRVSALSPL